MREGGREECHTSACMSPWTELSDELNGICVILFILIAAAAITRAERESLSSLFCVYIVRTPTTPHAASLTVDVTGTRRCRYHHHVTRNGVSLMKVNLSCMLPCPRIPSQWSEYPSLGRPRQAVVCDDASRADARLGDSRRAEDAMGVLPPHPETPLHSWTEGRFPASLMHIMKYNAADRKMARGVLVGCLCNLSSPRRCAARRDAFRWAPPPEARSRSSAATCSTNSRMSHRAHSASLLVADLFAPRPGGWCRDVLLRTRQVTSPFVCGK